MLNDRRTTNGKISKVRGSRHLPELVCLAITLCWAQSAVSQSKSKVTQLTSSDIDSLLSQYERSSVAENVQTFQTHMPPAVEDRKFRNRIRNGLPPEFAKIEIEDQELTTVLARLLQPVLMIYGRNQKYDLVVIDTSTPLMMSDSGVVLVVSTGLIGRVRSDDELLGYVAHEVAHEYFAQYSIHTRRLVSVVNMNGNEASLIEHTTLILQLIELQCDAFAALTLLSIGRNPLALAESLGQVEREFQKYSDNQHPPVFQRRWVIERLSSQTLLYPPLQQSTAFWKIKQLLIAREQAKRVGLLPRN